MEGFTSSTSCYYKMQFKIKTFLPFSFLKITHSLVLFKYLLPWPWSVVTKTGRLILSIVIAIEVPTRKKRYKKSFFKKLHFKY